jgi:hypothetical protein
MKTVTGKIVVSLVLVLFLVGVVLFFTIQRPTKAEPTDRHQSSWKLIRETADEDGATFAAVYDLTGVGTTDGDFASMDSSTVANGGPYQIRSTGGSGRPPSEGISAGTTWMFAICGEDYNDVDDTFSFNLVGWSKTNGMLQVICEGDGVLGTQAVGIYPDSGDALGALISETSVGYTHATETFVVTNAGFTNAEVGMMARVTGTGFTNEIADITTVTDVNTIVCDITTSAANCTDATVQINPAFWADTINLDETTKWSGAQADPNGLYGYSRMPGTIAVINSGDNEVACLVVDLTGIEYIQFVFYDCDGYGGTAAEAGNMTVYGRPY